MTDTTLADRSVLRVSGDDVRGFLQGLVTQDVACVLPDAPQWSGLLTPQGKALYDFMLWDSGDGAILIDCEAAQAEALARRLMLYRLRRAIQIAVTDLAVHWSIGDVGKPVDPRLPGLGQRWVDAAANGDASTTWRAHRLSLGVVEGADELGQDATLWLECNARELNGVSFTKGCYVGQENTARMHHRSRVNRRLVVVPIGAEGAKVRARYADLGVVVELRRIEALGDIAKPNWLTRALGTDTESSDD